MPTPADLLEEIQSGPLAAALAAPYAANNDALVAAVLNTADITPTGTYKVLTRADILRTITGLGAGPALQAAEATNPAAWALMRMLPDPDSSVDMNEAGNQALVPVLNAVVAGLGDALLTAAAPALISRAAQLGWGVVTQEDVYRTRSIQ